MSETEVVQRAYCAGSSLSPENNQKKTSEYIVCYVCGGNGANWSLYTKANEKEKSPYFPFLESMEKAKGAKERENGRIDACTVCFSFLLQQWHAYEELCTPVDKRSYWLKRTGTGGIDFNYGNHGSGVEDTARVMKDLENSQKAGEPCQKVMGKDRENYTEPSNDHAEEEQDRVKEGVLKQELQAVVPVKTVNSGTKESEGFMSKNNINDYETFDSCFVCGSRKFKDVMRTVHTKPQLKTETPFYPFLLHHNSLPEAKKIEFMGKVTVCQTCDTILFKQWQNFQKQGIPLSERQYRLPFSLDRLPKQSLKTYTCTIVCFICGEKCPEVSGCDIHTRKGRPGNPYFPFLSRLSPAAGAKPVTAEGLVKTCTDCYNSLLNQWKFFESRDLDERNREYSISNKLATVSKSQTAPDNEVCASDIRCYVCNLFYPDHKIHYIKQPWDKSCVTSSYNGQQIGTIPVCSHCKEDLYKKAKAQNVESNSAEKEEQLNIKQQHKKGMILNNSNLRDHMISNVNHENSIISGQVTVSMDVCFLCGGKFEAATSKQLCVLPRQGVNGCQPFFPSLAYIVPAPSARPLTASGTVVVCCYCHGNMINQWYECGQSDEAGISNPWSRHYFVRRFTCYLCGKTYPRQKITSISAKDYPFLDKLRRPARAFRINCEEDYVVCQHCKEIVYVQKENFDKCGAGIHEREYELPMVIYDSKMCHTYKVCKTF